MQVKKAFVFFSAVALGTNCGFRCFKLVPQFSLQIHLGYGSVAVGTLQCTGARVDPVAQQLVSIGHNFPLTFMLLPPKFLYRKSFCLPEKGGAK